MSTAAVVIELQPASTASLVEDVHSELSRLRRALGEAWTKRDDLAQAATVLLEAHGSLEVLDGLADELGMRAETGR